MASTTIGYVNVDPSSGSGNANVTATAVSDNTGRNQRSTVLTFSAANCSDVTTTVYQSGKTEYVSFDNATATVAKTGGNVTITGKSNSSKLTFSLGTGTDYITLPSSYTANSASTTNGAAITGDPGATSEFVFSITISNIGANTTISERTKQLIVTANGSQTATINVTQAAGDPTFSVSPSTITLDWDAYTQSSTETITVTSNTSWTVA